MTPGYLTDPVLRHLKARGYQVEPQGEAPHCRLLARSVMTRRARAIDYDPAYEAEHEVALRLLTQVLEMESAHP